MVTKKKKKPDVVVKVVEPPPVPVEARALSQIERLANIGNEHANKLNQTVASGLYAQFGAMTLTEIQTKLASPSLTTLERSIIIHIAKINSTSKDGMEAIKYLHDRTFGKMESKLEHTGAGGGAIKVESDIVLKIERTIANMSTKELEAFEETMFSVDSALGKFDGNEEG